MKKIGLLTLNGNYNYGNKLQHYALQEKLINKNFKVETIRFKDSKNIIINYIKHLIKLVIRKRYRFFVKFDKKINYYKGNTKVKNNELLNKKINNYFDYFVIGSDQVWNYNFNPFIKNYFLPFSEKKKNITYASSIGLEKISRDYNKVFKVGLKNLNKISVRENRAKEIIGKISNRKDVEVLIDPTMLLTSKEWDKVSKRPKQLNNIKEEKYILNYFLGNLSEERKKEIERIAKENNCYIINLKDKKSKFYSCGPSEFLYLEKNAFLICTDSFHSSVFAILYNTPFIVFDREDNKENMSSRIDTLLSKFKLEDRKYNGKITKELLKCDYKEAHIILEKEREKSEKFLKNALDIK